MSLSVGLPELPQFGNALFEVTTLIEHGFYSSHCPLVDQCGIILVHAHDKPHVLTLGCIDEMAEPVPARAALEGDTEAATAEGFPPPQTVRLLHVASHNCLKHVGVLFGTH
jgi:hypothetical protein